MGENLITPKAIEMIKESIELLGQTSAEATATMNTADLMRDTYLDLTPAERKTAAEDFLAEGGYASVETKTGAKDFLAGQGYDDAPLGYNRAYALSVFEATGDLVLTDPAQYELIITSL